MIHKRFQRSLAGTALAGAVLALASCGGGSSSGSGSLTLGITDAAVDDAIEVNVVFTGIMLKPQDGEPITFQCDEPAGDPAFDCGGKGWREIDLLALSGDESETLLDDVSLASGRYDWIRLLVNARGPAPSTLPHPNFPETNIVLESAPDVPEPLLIPSGPQTGLKLVQGFNVPVNGDAAFTIDFDLRKAVTLADTDYMLRPAFRLVATNDAGHLAGEITLDFVQDNCPSVEFDGDGDVKGGLAVYVFEGGNATTDDLGDPNNEPLTTDRAELDDKDGNFDYRIGFLAAGEYTVAVTCEADSDDEDLDESIQFVATVNDVTVTAGNEPTILNFD